MRIVEWQEQVTETGIRVIGNTTVRKRGEILSTHAFPMVDASGRQGLATLIVVRAFENGRIFSMDSSVCIYIDENDGKPEPLRKNELSSPIIK